MINNSETEFYRILSSTISKRLNNLVDFDKVISSIDYYSAKEFEFISFINITGGFYGTLFLFATKDSLSFIFENIFQIDYKAIEEQNLLQDSLDEFLNLIIANSTEEFSVANFPISIGVPREKTENSALMILSQLKSGILLNTPRGRVLLTFEKRNK